MTPSATPIAPRCSSSAARAPASGALRLSHWTASVSSRLARLGASGASGGGRRSSRRVRRRLRRSSVRRASQPRRPPGCGEAEGRNASSPRSSSSTITPRFHSTSAQTGGASRLMRCAGPSASATSPSIRPRPSAAGIQRPRHSGCASQSRTCDSRGPRRRSAAAARRARKRSGVSSAGASSSATREAQRRSSSPHSGCAGRAVSKARSSSTWRAFVSSMAGDFSVCAASDPRPGHGTTMTTSLSFHPLPRIPTP